MARQYTPDHAAIVALELAHARYDGLTQQAAYALFHAPTQSRQVQRLAPLTISAALGLLAPTSLAKVANWVHLLDLRAKIQSQDREGVATYAAFMLAAGLITSDEHTAVAAQLQATETLSVTEPVTPRVVVVGSHEPGFPNYLTPEEFAAAWLAAGRSE